MYILGISAFYHDSAACLLKDGEIVAAAQEERFSRRKHDHRFPAEAVAYCLEEGGVEAPELDRVVFYDKPWLKFERLLETYLAFAPAGLGSFLRSMPLWLKEKLWMEDVIRSGVGDGYDGPLLYPEHHQSHAASAFFPSPFEHAAVLTIDGVGEWATASWGAADGNTLTLQQELRFPHSLGLLYTAFTYYTGFRVNSGEYKVMGLAPYGEPRYRDLILEHLMDLREDGSFRLDMSYFNYCQGLTMTSPKFARLFGGEPRQPESELTQRDMDLARSVQDVAEEVILKMARHVQQETGESRLCLAGGVALNCVANGKLLRSGLYDDIWIQPAAGDAGGALGAALFVAHQVEGIPRPPRPGSAQSPQPIDGQVPDRGPTDASSEGLAKGVYLATTGDSQRGSYLGPGYSADEIDNWLTDHQLPFERVARGDVPQRAAELIAAEKVLGLFTGRMEFGPRALGGRSIIGDARSAKMQSIMNLKIKYRESFRPFAPACLVDDVSEFFELDRPSPYMLIVAELAQSRRLEMSAEEQSRFGIDKLHVARSDIPAVTHVDYSARVQTVHRETNPRFYDLITEFKRLTGYGVVVNTSFNVRGEPIVCTPEDAYLCFMRTEMDALLLEDCLLLKSEQPPLENDDDWRELYALD